MKKIWLIVLLSASVCSVFAQSDSNSVKSELKTFIEDLASPEMYGRGYVKNGRKKAADYIQKAFSDAGLTSPKSLKHYSQTYTFPVNTFPEEMTLELDGKELHAGADYLIDAASAPFKATQIPLRETDLASIRDMRDWQSTISSYFKGKYAWYLKNVDSFCKKAGIRLRAFAETLPEGCFIITQSKKQMWTVSKTQIKATVFYVKEDVMPSHTSYVSVEVSAKLQQKAKSENIIGIVAGELTDSFIVFSAHYDHLGKMGNDATFCGASDNASGTAMLLHLAGYYAKHPQRYTMVFIAFSGEEAGLMGSAYYVDHAAIPVNRMRLVMNIDIMGDATDGITAVNATEFPEDFALLNDINEEHHYLPIVKSRGTSANSDHYHFSERGVHAFFIYSMGGKGYYHDIYDKSEEVTLNNVAGVAQLLKDFTDKLQGTKH